MDPASRAGWLALLVAGAALAEPVAITGATVIDATEAPPRIATVVIEGERIVAVGESAPRGARVVRADGHTLLPGLFDLHTHVAYSTTGAPADWPANLKAYVDSGVTSVADFGTYGEAFEPMRRLWREGKLSGPRVSYASRIGVPGGHGTEGGRGGLFTLEALTSAEGRAAMRRLLPYEPGAIKVFTDGWRYGGAPDMTSMREDTLAAIAEEAHARGLPVLTHTVTLAQAKIAARAGVDVLAHGIGDMDADEELIRIMKQKRTFYAPTLAVYEPRSPDAAAWRKSRWGRLLRNVALLRSGGIPFANGTDAGMPGITHGRAALREMQLLVRGGLTPLEAIRAATIHSARALKVDGERGAIAPGKMADLVLVEGSPHLNIADMEKVRRVWLGGREVDRAAKPLPFPVAHAHRTVDDFERPDGRSTAGTLWIDQTDGGHDKTRVTYLRVLRGETGHALFIAARMAEKDKPFARISVPLHRGAVEPADASAFEGARFDARGEGEYRFRAIARGGRTYEVPFHAGGIWQTIRMPFGPDWNTPELLMLQFEIARAAGESAWLELDNVRFY
jgi:imidazolonepropionase-like amidohydrolase